MSERIEALEAEVEERKAAYGKLSPINVNAVLRQVALDRARSLHWQERSDTLDGSEAHLLSLQDHLATQ